MQGLSVTPLELEETEQLDLYNKFTPYKSTYSFDNSLVSSNFSRNRQGVVQVLMEATPDVHIGIMEFLHPAFVNNVVGKGLLMCSVRNLTRNILCMWPRESVNKLKNALCSRLFVNRR